VVSASSTELSAADSVMTFGIQKLDVPFISLDSLLVMLALSMKIYQTSTTNCIEQHAVY